MNFLAPLFLLGGLAVALPIIFHLIRRTPTLQRHFSSLMFLAPSPPQLSRRSRLDKILLLLLRCLIIGLVAFAFARPFWRDKLPAQSGSAPEQLSIVLVDASASMKRQDLWKEAVERAVNFARRASPADRVQFMLFDRGSRKLMSFDEWSALTPQQRGAAVEQRLRATEPTWFAGELGSALIGAAEELNVLGQLNPATSRRLVVISDFQEGSRMQNLQGFDWPAGLQVILEPVEAKHRDNAGLHVAAESETAPAGAGEARPLVRVSNAADARRDQFRLAWLDASGATLGNAIDVQVVAGRSRVVRAPQRPQGAAQLVLTGDNEPFDNTLFIAAPEPERVQVAFLGSGQAEDPTEVLFYLNRAFQETRRRSVTITHLPEGGRMPPGVKFAVVASELRPDEAASVRGLLEQGGTVLLVIKNLAAANALEQLTGHARPAVTEAAVKQYAMLEQIDFEHPVFAPFAEPRFSDFTKIHFWKYRRLETNDLANARVLARFDGGAPALFELGVGSGKLLVLTSGWHPADSQFALSSKFVPLLYSMLEYAGCFKEQISLLVTGSEVPVREAGMSLRRPDGSAVSATAGRWLLDQPGIFTVSQGTAAHRLGVNVDPAESRTAPLDPAELQKLGVPLGGVSARTAALIDKERKWARAAEVESRQKLWRWLIVAALVFVLVETWFAARLSRPTMVASA
jgi:hypothetical protein